MKFTFATILFAVLLAACVSCSNDTEPIAWAEGDAFIVTRYVVAGEDTTAVYGLALYTYGNNEHVSASVAGPGGTTYDLVPFRDSAIQYFWETSEDDFAETLPATGTYTFTITVINAGAEETITSTDVLTSEALAPLFITGHEYNAENNRLQLTWQAVSGVKYYIIEMEDQAGNIVFKSASTTSASYNIIAESTSVYWAEGHPVPNSAYRVSISGYMNETTQTGKSLYIQAKSVSSRDVIWGNTE